MRGVVLTSLAMNLGIPSPSCVREPRISMTSISKANSGPDATLRSSGPWVYYQVLILLCFSTGELVVWALGISPSFVHDPFKFFVVVFYSTTTDQLQASSSFGTTGNLGARRISIFWRTALFIFWTPWLGISGFFFPIEVSLTKKGCLIFEASEIVCSSEPSYRLERRYTQENKGVLNELPRLEDGLKSVGWKNESTVIFTQHGNFVRERWGGFPFGLGGFFEWVLGALGLGRTLGSFGVRARSDKGPASSLEIGLDGFNEPGPGAVGYHSIQLLKDLNVQWLITGQFSKMSPQKSE
ncbi:hypothetical protein F5890DRAFT_1476026 [Lentinula detonsa]|uniref:Uncharacterized protein n=1 Tax=Lentinula detonsa TaxID=2804962 RepID=A0AA38UQY5_9AGAR|nr:hypothetical protein F5890DRAFT_1476026 [Lentinula detonsa]